MTYLDDRFAVYPESLRVQHAAEILNVALPTTYRWLRDGVIPGYKVGTTWVLLRDELKAHVAAGHNGHGAARGARDHL
jgi:excisionase family DNA binding protein